MPGKEGQNGGEGRASEVMRRPDPVHVHREVNDQPVSTDRVLEHLAPVAPQVVQNPARFAKRSNPLMKNKVDMTATVPLTVPDDALLRGAYLNAGLDISEYSWKRRMMLSDCRDRYHMQQQLRQKLMTAPQVNAGGPVLAAIPLKDSIKLSDERLVEQFVRYHGKGGEYLEARYQLLNNRYYALLPIKTMRALPRHEIMGRLRKLYAEQGPDRNEELIRYYQAIIITGDFERAEKEAQARRGGAAPQLQLLDLPRTGELLVKNSSAFNRNADVMRKSFITVSEYNSRMAAMKSVLIPGNRRSSWKAGDTSIDDTKRESMRRILEWMYRNCCRSSESKEPFVYKLTQARSDQLLLMFYLIEHDMMSAPSAQCYQTAMNDYVPSLEGIRDKVVASKWKFWKRMGRDHNDMVLNWTKLGAAARFALNCDILEDHRRYTDQIAAAERNINGASDDDHITKRDQYLALLNAKGRMLLTMYRSAGLSNDMPPQLIEDLRLRQKVLTMLAEFKEDTAKLIEEINLTGYGNSKKTLRKLKKDKKAEDAEGQEEEGIGEDIEDLAAAGRSTDMIEGLVRSLKVFGNPVSDAVDTPVYAGVVGGLGAVSGILGFISSIVNAHGIRLGADAMSAAEHTARSIGVTQDMMESVNGIVVGTTGLTGVFTDLGETEQVMGLYHGGVRSASEAFSSVSGGIEFVTGCVSVVTGGLQIASGSVEHRRAISSKKDLVRSRRAFDAKKLQVGEAGLTEEQKKLRRLLDHQDRAVQDQKVTAGWKIAAGTVKMAAGALTVSGILAPLGGLLALTGTILDVGAGVLYARHRKRMTRKAAVDDGLGLDAVIDALKRKSEKARAADPEELRNRVRQEELGKRGYSNYKQFFSDICREYAMLLYKHVFQMSDTDPDYNMYLDALKSLGTKLVIPKDHPGQRPFPTPEVIYAKLMG